MANERVAILYSGSLEARRDAALGNPRFADLFKAFAEQGMRPEPMVYRDDFCEEVRDQLKRADGVLVWVDPIVEGRDRTILDALLREAADAGVFVSTEALGTEPFASPMRPFCFAKLTNEFGG